MLEFTEDHSKALLGKEWLIKIDTQRAIPYLLKFHLEPATASCCMIITDTKSVWAEVLTSNQFARRWHSCHRSDEPPLGDDDERLWRQRKLELVAQAHTLGGIKDLNFVTTEPRYGDFAFELEGQTIKWRWETVSLGPKISAEILSKHLIIPLISVTHLAFSSADPVSELSEADLEKAVDKMGRSARRILETHVKHAISKPRVATTIQRMTAVINFLPEFPAITSVADQSVIIDSTVPLSKVTSPRSKLHSPSPIIPPPRPPAVISAPTPPVTKPDTNSDTESDSEDPSPNKGKGKAGTPVETPDQRGPPKQQPPAPKAAAQSKPIGSSSDSSPARPPKKSKRPISSSDDDSEEERRRRVAQLKGGAAASSRGTKQPVKRGGKRF